MAGGAARRGLEAKARAYRGAIQGAPLRLAKDPILAAMPPSASSHAMEPSAAARPSFTTAGFRRGYALAQPMAIGVFAYAVTFGLLASDAGLSALEAVFMSALVYSGTAQVATVGALGSGIAAIIAGVVTVVMLNARYMLYGAALRPWLGQATATHAYASLYFLGDGNWILSMKAHADGESDAAFVLGSGLAMFLPWVGGTLLGCLAGGWMANPKLLALDFLLTAFCAAMAAGLFKSRSDLGPAAAALAVALLVNAVAPSGWTIVLAGLTGAAVAYWRHVPGGSEPESGEPGIGEPGNGA
jgi:predicted branched-subunit amino acid permease